MNRGKNLFSIGEIANLIHITRKIILNYEAKGLIKPDLKEGAAGNRYYSIDTFTQIRTIRVFQNLGLSLDEIRDYFDDKIDLPPLIRRLESMRDELNLNIERLYERTNKTQNRITKITVEPQTVYCRTCCTHDIAEKSAMLRDTALEATRIYGTDTTKRMYFIEYPLKDPDDITYSIAVPPGSSGEGICYLPAFSAVSTFHHGAYEEIPKIQESLIHYAKENGIRLSQKCRHVYLEGPPQHKDPHKFITQVLIPIRNDEISPTTKDLLLHTEV